MSNVVARDVASKDIEKWLDYKKVSDRKRTANKESIEVLIDAVEDGILVLNEDYTLTHKLKFPIENEIPVTELVYIPRLKVSTVHNKLKGISATSPDERVLAYASALTGKVTNIIKDLETEDYSLVQSVVLFFL